MGQAETGLNPWRRARQGTPAAVGLAEAVGRGLLPHGCLNAALELLHNKGLGCGLQDERVRVPPNPGLARGVASIRACSNQNELTPIAAPF